MKGRFTVSPFQGSFRRQIILAFVVGFSFLMTAFATFQVHSETLNLYSDSRDRTTAIARSLAISSRSWILANDVVGLQEVVTALQNYGELRYAMIISPSGRVLAHTDASKIGLFLSDELSRSLLEGFIADRTLHESAGSVDIAVPVEVDGKYIGWARVAFGREDIARNLRQTRLHYAVFVLVACTLSLLAAVLIANRLGRRIGSLMRTADEIQAGNFDTRAVISDGADEITALSASFNQMLDVLAWNERELKAVSNYTRNLIEASLDPLVTISPEGTITDVNAATEKITGRSRSELIGSDFSDNFTEPDRAREGYEQVFKNGYVHDYPLSIRHSDGRIAEVLYNASLYRNKEGEVLGVFAAARDITERKQAESVRLQLAAIVESSSDAIIGKTVDGIVTSWNSGAERMYGYSAAEILGRHITVLAPPDRHGEATDLMAAALSGGIVSNHETVRCRKDGEHIDVALTISPIRDRSGHVTGISTIARDISRRKKLERERDQNLRFFESMDRVNLALHGRKDINEMLSDVLDVVIEIFACDRAFLMYPCDPGAASWSVPVERNKPEYPGVLELGLEMPMNDEVAQTLAVLLEAGGPVKFGPDEQYRLPAEVSERFGFKCFMSMAIHPRIGNAWQFGLHQCSHVRHWTEEEQRLFEAIGRRLADALTTVIMYADLQAGEQRYRLVFDNSPVPIWEEDFSEVKALLDALEKEGVGDIESYFEDHPEIVQQCAQLTKIVDVNHAALALHRATSKEELLARLVDTFTPESFATFRKELVCLWHGGTEMSSDGVVRTLDGDIRNVSVYFSVCAGHEKTLSRVIVSLIDITERKRTEEALGASEAELRALVNAMTDVIFVGDSTGRYLKIVETNPSKLYRPSKELLGKTLHDVFPREQADFFLSKISTTLETREPINFEYSLLIGTELLWFNATISPLSDDTTLMVARDITDRKHSEDALRSTADRLAQAQRMARLGNWELDLTTNVLTWSDEIYRIFELDPDQFPASYEGFLNAIHPADRDMVNDAYSGSVASRTPYDIIHRLLMKDGRIKYVNERCETDYNEDGRPLRSRGTVHDITERVRSEEAQRRLNRELRAISDCNQALLRAEDESTLLHDVCRIICEEAGYRMAWVGFAEQDEEKTVRPVAWAGVEEGYLTAARITWADEERGRGPTGKAIRTGESACVQDFSIEEEATPWREEALRHGYRSSIALPLKDDEKRTFGALNIYSGDPAAFTEHEERLLEELAGDLAFGITVLRSRNERKLAEAALRQSEEKYRTLIQKIQAAVVVHAADTRILIANSQAEEILGLTEKQLTGKTAIDPDWHFFREDGRVAEQEDYPVNQVLASLRPIRNQVLGIHRPGRKNDVWVLVNADPILDEDGNLNQIIVTFIDITERKRTEQALHESEWRYREIFDNVLDGLYLLEVTENGRFRTIAVNPALERITGIPASHSVGKTQEETVPEEVARIVNAKYEHCVEAGHPIEEEVQLDLPTGRRFFHSTLIPARDEAGHIYRIVGITRDITDARQAEEEIRKLNQDLERRVEERTSALVIARNAAEAANQAKSVFLANMSHELRTPLNAILGFAELMHRDERLQEEQRQNLDIIRRSGDHLLTLINDVLEMAKIEAGRVQLDEAPFDLGRLVRDITDMMLIRAREKGLRLLIDQASEFPRFITGDEARLRQVLINLLSNAVKFTQKGGVTIRLGTRENHISHLVIEVEDSGPGIALEDQQRIFEPFVQLGEQGVNRGTGLGLTITRQFIRLMGGTIQLDSVPGRGSLFHVELPLKEVTEDVALVARGETSGDVTGLAPGQPEYRILIVEDQHDNQLLLSRLMTTVGFQVRVAENGEQGVRLFEEWRPHLIWMDRRMPVMDGLEATKKIRALPGGKDVRIVAVTASAFQEQRAELLAAGMDDFIRKPYRAGEIYECLARHLSLRFTYEGAQEPGQVIQLTSAMLSVLPAELLDRLKIALRSLDSERISHVIQEAALYDVQLQKALLHLADVFDYQAILDACERV